MNKRKVPKIRFKGFYDDWEQRKLGDMMNVTSVKRIHQSDWTDSGVRFLRARDIVAAAKNEEPDDYLYISKEKYEEYSALSGKVGVSDLLVTGVGTIGVPYLVRNLEPLYFKDGNIIWFQNSDKIDGKFLFYSFSAEQIQSFINESAGIGTVGTYTIESGKKTPISLPNQIEQAKIGEFFQQLDNLITLHQRKLEKLKIIKKSMLENCFPKNGEKAPKIRFSGFSNDWEQRKLWDVCEIKDSARIPNSEWTESGVPYIRASDVTNENIDGVLFISQERYEFYKNRTGAPTKDDVLFNGGGEIGKSLLITDENLIYVQGGAVLYARTSESSKLVGQYLKIYFETTHAKSYIDTTSAGGTMKHFTLKPSQMMPILMPSVDEQEKIGTYFSNLDHLITLHQSKLEKLKMIKKSMLETMFA